LGRHLPGVLHSRNSTALRTPVMSLYLKSIATSTAYPVFALYPPLLSLLQCIYCMPLVWRKYTLTVCRAQKSPFTNYRLLSMVNGLEESFPMIRNPVTSLPYTIESFMDSLHFISSSPIFCSLVSYFVRAERFEDESVPESVKYLGIIKELNAALQPDTPTSFVSSIYDRFNIDRKGLPNGTSWSFKGRHDKTYHTVTNMTFPPCTPEVFSTEWTELIATRYYRGTYVSIPLLVDHSIPAGPCYGLGHIVELCTLHRIQRIMSDLGYMEIENLKRTICLSEETLEDYQDVLLGNSLLRTCHRITCVKEPPEWYNVVIADEGPA
jgi:hypothetical protein